MAYGFMSVCSCEDTAARKWHQRTTNQLPIIAKSKSNTAQNEPRHSALVAVNCSLYRTYNVTESKWSRGWSVSCCT